MALIKVSKSICIGLIILAFAFHACTPDKPKVVAPKIEKKEKTEIKPVVKRYETALFNLDINNLKQGLKEISSDFSFFLGKEWSDTINQIRIKNFITDPNIKELYTLTMKAYPDVLFLQEGLGNAFEIYKQLYPEKPIPNVYTYVSGLDIENPVYFADTAIAIGLDVFLGSDAKVYRKAGIPIYKADQCIKENILPQCMRSISEREITVDKNKNTLLDQMIVEGKALYFLDITLPETADYNKIGYSTSQLEWCRSNEAKIWSLFIEKQALFSSNPQVLSKFLSDAPFTSGFEKDAPPRLGAYIGWQIVRQYMANSSNITMKQLMLNTNAQEILKISGYKPSK